jgi:hypothetical protein
MLAGFVDRNEKFLAAEWISTAAGCVPPLAVTVETFPFGTVVEDGTVVKVGVVKPVTALTA